MRKRIPILSALSVVVLALGACEGWVAATARLTQGAGEPMAGALACLVHEDRRLLGAELTDAQGCVRLSTTVSPYSRGVRLVLWYPGHRAAEVKAVPGSANEYTVRLSPAGAADAGEITPEATGCQFGFETPDLPPWVQGDRPIPEGLPVLGRLEKLCRQIPGVEVRE